MAWFIAKIIMSSVVIALTSWLAGQRPGLAGFIMALPLSTVLALAFTQIEFQSPEKSVEFAKSILLGVPLSLTFFVPFLFADKLKLPFWGLYGSGLACLAVSYTVHSIIFKS